MSLKKKLKKVVGYAARAVAAYYTAGASEALYAQQQAKKRAAQQAAMGPQILVVGGAGPAPDPYGGQGPPIYSGLMGGGATSQIYPSGGGPAPSGVSPGLVLGIGGALVAVMFLGLMIRR